MSRRDFGGLAGKVKELLWQSDTLFQVFHEPDLPKCGRSRGSTLVGWLPDIDFRREFYFSSYEGLCRAVVGTLSTIFAIALSS